MFPISYHGGHSRDVCDHAHNTKKSLVQAYLNKNFVYVGITEHLPVEDDAFLYEDERNLGHSAEFLCKRFEHYFLDQVPKLKSELNLDGNFLFGFETEYCGVKPLERIDRAIQTYQPELIVASVHHVNDIPVDFSEELYNRATANAGGLDALYLSYYDHQLKLIEHLQQYTPRIPVVLGHMDLIRLHSPGHPISEQVEHAIVRNITTARKAGIVFEVNARAFAKGLSEPYPQRAILARIVAEGGKLTLGDDAHGDSQVGMNYERLKDFLPAPVHVVKKNNQGYRWAPFV